MRGSGAAVPAAAPPPLLPRGAPAPFLDTLQSQKTERRSGALVEECQAIKSDHYVFMRKINEDETPLQKQTGASHVYYASGKNHRLGCPASCTVFLPAEPNFINEFRESYFDQ